MTFNVFHTFGDVSHTISKLVLIWAIHSNSSAEGELSLQGCIYTSLLTRPYRCFAHHPGPLRRCFLRTIPRHIRVFRDKGYRASLELLAEDILHPVFTLYHLPHDKRVCANKGTRKGLEVWHALPLG
jgi:hypothetical protein